jgi:ubiquinone/menaquinone biosynthesis C-methylase UbiE
VSTDREIKRLKDVYERYEQQDMSARRWSLDNAGNRAIMAERRRATRTLLSKHGLVPLGERKLLEIGCGTGHVLAAFEELGARPENLHGIDLLPQRIERARMNFPRLHFEVGNAEALDHPDASFDLVLLFVVLSSILDPVMRHNVAHECTRVLCPGGSILWYDIRFDNPQNRNIRGITRPQIAELFPGFDLDACTLTLVPQLARRLGPLTPRLYPLLAAVPVLRTYTMALLSLPV